MRHELHDLSGPPVLFQSVPPRSIHFVMPPSPSFPPSYSKLRQEFDELKRLFRDLEEKVTERLDGLDAEFDAAVRRVRSETQEENQKMMQSFDQHISRVVREGLQTYKAQLDKIDKVFDIVERIEDVQAKVHRLEPAVHRFEIREDAEKLRQVEKKQEQEALAQQLDLANKAVEIQVKQVDMRLKQDSALDLRIDGSHKRKIAWLTLLISLLTLAVGGGGYTLLSHFLAH